MADFSQREKSIFLQLFPKLPEDKLKSIPLAQKEGSSENEKLVYCFKDSNIERRIGKKRLSLKEKQSFKGIESFKGTLYPIERVLLSQRIGSFIDDHFKKTNLSQKRLVNKLVRECVDNLKRFKKDKAYRKKTLKKIFKAPFKFKETIPHECFFIALALFQAKEHNLFLKEYSKKKFRTLLGGSCKSEDEFLKKYWKKLQAMKEINYLSEVCYEQQYFCLEDNLRFNYSRNQKKLLKASNKDKLLKYGKRAFKLFLSENEKLKDDTDSVSQKDVYYSKSSSEAKLKELEKKKPKFVTNKGIRKCKTHPELSKSALKKAKYKCQYDSTHKTFKSGKEHPFTEAHHLIPMSKQDYLKPKTIDIRANIVSLCPNCHRAVHLGNKKEKEDRLKKLYKIKEKGLRKKKLCKNVEELLNHYNR